MESIFDRIPPQNIDAEKAVIGSMLLDNAVIPDVLDLVNENSFLRLAHQRAFNAIRDLYEHSDTVDPLLLFEELRRRGQLDEDGQGELTVDYISEMFEATPTAANAVYYARIVSEKSLTRQVILSATELIRKGYDATQPGDELLEEAEAKILQLIRGAQRNNHSLTMRDACLQYVESLRQGRHRVFGSGIVDLDNAIGGAGLGEMIVLAARPSHGKSAFALDWLHNASAAGVPSAIISEEMAAIELGKRAMLRFTSIDQELWNSETAEILEDEVKQHYGKSAPIFVAENCHTIGKAEAAIRRYAELGVKVVAIDYLQLLSGAGQKRYEQVGEVSRRIKLAAQKHDVAILALSQLNRGIEDRQVYQPKLRDLRESGSIEQDADAVLFLIWPWASWHEDDAPTDGKTKQNQPEPDKREYRIIVGKNCRNRRTNKRKLIINFDCDRMTFWGTEPSRDAAPYRTDEVDRFFARQGPQ